MSEDRGQLEEAGLKSQIAGGYSDYRHYQTLVMSLLRFIA
jgi:hypothetical protein